MSPSRPVSRLFAKKPAGVLAAVVSSAALLISSPASAVTIIGDFSQLGTVYGNSDGLLTNTAGLAGYTDVTAGFEADFNAAATIWQRALMVPFTLTTTVTLANLGNEHAVGDSLITSTGPAPYYLPATSQIRVDDSTQSPTYIGTNPYDSSAFNIVNQTADLNGNTVNIARFGSAVAGGPADNQYDLLTLFLHELEHSLGFADDMPSGYDTLLITSGNACGTGATEGQLTIPSTLSGGLPFNLPVACNDPSHIDGVINNALFNNTTVPTPGFGVNQRALITGADIYALCAADGATSAQCNPNPSFGAPAAAPVPEPGSLLVLSGALTMLGVYRRRSKS